MTTLYWGPHTCAIGIHVLLEEIGAPYDTVKLDAAGGETRRPPFSILNPKQKVPTVVQEDGAVLTEYGAIARALAYAHPEAGLLPADRADEIRAQAMMDYAIGTVHVLGFARIFKPARFEPDDVLHDTLGLGAGRVKAQGRTIAEAGLGILANQLGDREWAGGTAFGIADTALFYVARWAPEVGIALPPPLDAYLARMRARPAVRRVMEIWGEPVD